MENNIAFSSHASSLSLFHSHSHSLFHSHSYSLTPSLPLPLYLKAMGKISSSEDFKNVQTQLKFSNVQNSLKCNCTLFFLQPPGEAGFNRVHVRPRQQMWLFGRPVFFLSLQCTSKLFGNLALVFTMGMGKRGLTDRCRPMRKNSKHFNFWGHIYILSSLREDNFKNRRPFPAMSSHQQKQYQECSLHKIYISLSLLFLLVVHICLFS